MAPGYEGIAAYACQLWEAEGCQGGQDLHCWLQVELYLQVI